MDDFEEVVAGLSELLSADLSNRFWYTGGQKPSCYLRTNMTANQPACKQRLFIQVKLKRCRVFKATRFYLLHGSIQGQWSYYLLNCFLSQSGCPWKYLSAFDKTLETTCHNCKSNWMGCQFKVPVWDYDGVEWGQLSWSAVWTCVLCDWPIQSL